jgi:hypothetical protein
MEKGRRDTRLLNQRGKAYLRGPSPMHLDHVNVACVDPAAGEAFLADRLGFLRREYVQPTDGPVVASWMSVTSQEHDNGCDRQPRCGSRSQPVTRYCRRRLHHRRPPRSVRKASAPLLERARFAAESRARVQLMIPLL